MPCKTVPLKYGGTQIILGAQGLPAASINCQIDPQLESISYTNRVEAIPQNVLVVNFVPKLQLTSIHKLAVGRICPLIYSHNLYTLQYQRAHPHSHLQSERDWLVKLPQRIHI